MNYTIEGVSLWLIFAFRIKFFIHLIFYLSGSSSQMALSLVPSSALEMPQVRNDFFTISSAIFLQNCFIQRRKRFLDATFLFPAGLNSKGLVIIHDRYSLLIFSMKGLFRHFSNGCRTGARPPRITATSIFCSCNASLTDSVRWARKES